MAQPVRPTLRRARGAALLIAVGLATACTSLRPPIAGQDQDNDILKLPPAEEPVPEARGEVAVDDEADWIRLVSGEWLRGKLVRIREDEVDFESDELGDLTIDLGDVDEIHTAGPEVVVTEDGQTLRGRIVLKGEDLWVEGRQTVQIPRDELLASLVYEDGTARDWSGRITLGATTRSGNTEQDDFSAFAEAIRETALTRWRSSYNGVLSRASGVETANNHRVRSVYDVHLSRRFFVTIPSVDAYRDPFQNIDYRVTAAAALGYEVIDTDDHDWSVSVGPAYQETRFDEAPPGGDRDDSTAAAVALSEYAWDVTSDVDLEFDYAITAPVPDAEEYNHNFVLRLSVDLIGELKLDVAFVWDRVNEPIADTNGVMPEKNDYRTSIGLTWSF